ncbi:unnamed protein product [Larinioides sclopetarius]|uniref:Tudor domain-containing protein n=1 Tax=Larinioides sclopetarius TaxID=280406 RepID=A0AAV2A9U1_9ARAC
MVKLRQYSGGSEDQMPQCSTSCSAEASPDALKMNGNAWKNVLVNGNCSDMASVEEIQKVNGHGDKMLAKKVVTMNGNSSNAVLVNKMQAVNGHCEMSAKKVPTVNGISSIAELVNDIQLINGHSDKMSAKTVYRYTSTADFFNDVLAINRICDEVSAEEVPIKNVKDNDKNSEYFLNGPSTLPGNGSGSSVHTSDSLGNEDNSDENQLGFIEVVNKKKRNKNRNRNHRQKPNLNLPPGRSTESMRRDNGNDKNCGEKTSPSNLSQKPPTRNFAAVRSSGKSYSSVLANRQNGTSHPRNGGQNISSDTQNITKCTKSNTSITNCTLPVTNTSVDQLSTELTKSAVINETSAASCKQSNLSSKVEMTDVSAQTDICSQNETSPCQKECLTSHEEIIHESEKVSSPSDYVDVGEISDESSNAAYCDSVDELCEAAGYNVELNNDELCEADGYSVELINDELCEAAGYNVELNNDELCVCEAAGYNVELNNDEMYGADGYNVDLYNVSNDSGRGDSEITYDESMPYCCEFPREKTSQLIGRGGSFKYEIERKSGVIFWVYAHEYDKDLSIVCMIGTGAQIEKAKELIKERFRNATLRQWLGFNPINPPLSEKYLPILPEGTDSMGVVSCICDPSFFWVQQYGHPHWYSLEDLERRMSEHFNTVTDAPAIENPTIGSVIAVPGVRDGDNVKWIRGWVINIIPEEEKVVVRYLDHGGDHLVPISNIRPMRHDFFSMPFFAAQCCLYDILPTGGVWSDEARAEFTRLCNSSTCPPIVRVMYKTPECYFVEMIGYDSEINAQVNIAAHLITKGFGVRPCFPATEFPSELQH